MVKLFQTHFFVDSYAVLFIAKCCSLHEKKIAANVMTLQQLSFGFVL
jgi:hypothetical protein